MMNQIKTFLADEEGASAVEYGLIVGLIAVAIVTLLTAIGGKDGSTGLGKLFTTVNTKLTNAGS